MLTTLWVFLVTNVLLVIFLASGAMLTWMWEPDEATADTHGVGNPEDTTLAVHDYRPVLHVFLRNSLLLPTILIAGFYANYGHSPSPIFDALIIAWVVLILWFLQEHKKYYDDPAPPVGGDD